ncbi:MAG: esterase family protein [Clostridia bacterium]|nr:esterase family protein [Clostridia bacterium]
MALIEVNYFSDILGMQTKMNVILPQYPGLPARTPIPVLYLLHGMSQTYSSWTQYSMIEQYAEERGFAVIMPDANMSWYTDMKRGYAYWTHLTEELPNIVHRFFPSLSDKREDTFVAGLSMGAYGAIKFGMLRPDLFSYVGAFSPPPDMAHHMNNPDFPDWEHWLYHDIFGTEEEYHASENDLYTQAPLRRDAVGDTKFFLYCGTEDVYLPQSQSIANALSDADYDMVYKESPGDHNWWFWNRVAWEFINELPLKGGQ